MIDTIEELRAWYIGKRLNEQIIKDKNKEIIRYSKESDKVFSDISRLYRFNESNV